MQEHADGRRAEVRVSFHETVCMLCIAAVLAKAMVACLSLVACSPKDAFSLDKEKIKIRKSIGKKDLQGAGRSILILWERKVA